jgi:hypothetical protein
MVDIVSIKYCKHYGWIVYAVDAEGNQLWEADYYPNKKILKKAFQC